MAVIKIDNNNFKKEILESKGICLVDFWASWCIPCRRLSPIVDEVADEESEIKVAKINVEEEQELAVRYDIMSIPTLVVFKDGKEIRRSSGVIPKSEIKKLINAI